MTDETRVGVEAGRLAALRRYEILDTPPEPAFDAITSLAALLLDVPFALISLVDSDRVWFKSRVGVDAPEVARPPGPFSWALMDDGASRVGATAAGRQTSAGPLVIGKVGFRFHEAASLRTHDGHQLGTLCVFDREPREIEGRCVEILEILAGLVMDRLELRLECLRAAGRCGDLAARVAELEARHAASECAVATAAHDLRNSLGGIMMMAKLLLEEKFGALAGRQRQMVESICGSGDQMVRVVEASLETRGEISERGEDGVTAGTGAERSG